MRGHGMGEDRGAMVGTHVRGEAIEGSDPALNTRRIFSWKDESDGPSADGCTFITICYFLMRNYDF